MEKEIKMEEMNFEICYIKEEEQEDDLKMENTGEYFLYTIRRWRGNLFFKCEIGHESASVFNICISYKNDFLKKGLYYFVLFLIIFINVKNFTQLLLLLRIQIRNILPLDPDHKTALKIFCLNTNLNCWKWDVIKIFHISESSCFYI